MPERIKPSCQYNLSDTSSIYLQIYALGRGKNSTKRKKFHEEQKDHKCKQAFFHFPTFPKLLLILVFYSVSTGTYFISFDNTKMNLDVIEIWQVTYILGCGYIPIHILIHKHTHSNTHTHTHTYTHTHIHKHIHKKSIWYK